MRQLRLAVADDRHQLPEIRIPLVSDTIKINTRVTLRKDIRPLGRSERRPNDSTKTSIFTKYSASQNPSLPRNDKDRLQSTSS
ncbi:hypothetical protein K443DRAFT_3500 [Laccaria amethystina LaAM-08-1]|uniref:Unplaced genomic scaffold K443scaffold_21, whole genome shotgun sequence n=1 Tax=Laccaria amethystina LaAM-08-1 TaxID=1095629 RepID=A0A0C9XLN4_9AGAR|nr:hypothetical protein K443DRAFT_3500 [Laccaria amethystina LaAM-08-1]